MQESVALARLIPRIRRYAYALTGSKSVGDDYVAACLAKYVASPRPDGNRARARELFRCFHSIWDDFGVQGSYHESGPEVEQILGQLPAGIRAAFLLRTMEGFDSYETATILETDEFFLRRSYNVALRAYHRVDRDRRVLVIEDDHIVARHIGSLIDEIGLTQIGPARSSQEAVDMANEMRPSAMVVDINLEDGLTGLNAIGDIRSRLDIPAIFVTALPEQAKQVMKRGDFLVPKPFKNSTVRSAIKRSVMAAAA